MEIRIQRSRRQERNENRNRCAVGIAGGRSCDCSNKRLAVRLHDTKKGPSRIAVGQLLRTSRFLVRYWMFFRCSSNRRISNKKCRRIKLEKIVLPPPTQNRDGSKKTPRQSRGVTQCGTIDTRESELFALDSFLGTLGDFRCLFLDGFSCFSR